MRLRLPAQSTGCRRKRSRLPISVGESIFRWPVGPPFRHLVYPVPPAGGLGVHLTLDLAGQARFGPDVEWISEVDYTVDPARGDAFYAAIRTYWPQLQNDALRPGYAGIRPKISGPTEPAVDFVVQGPAAHSVPGLVNLYGIESPGLTASIPLADEVVRQLSLSPAEQSVLAS
jgi:L-2-hydroxyglutarate oxidase LhgO